MKYRIRITHILTFLSLCSFAEPASGHWLDYPYGGGEKLFTDDSTIKDIRNKIDNYEWANNLYSRMKEEIASPVPETPFTKSFGSKSARVKDRALYTRISGDQRYVPEIVEAIVGYYRLDKPDEPFYAKPDSPSTYLWQRVMTNDVRLLWAYDMLKNHPLLKPYEETMNSRIKEAIHHLKVYEKSFTYHLNTRPWALAALAMYGSMADDLEAIDIAVNGKWGFKSILGETFGDGGAYRIEPARYSFTYVDCCLTIIAELSRKNNWKENLYHYEHPNGGSIHKMCLGMLNIVQPDGVFITCGDQSEMVEISDSGYIRDLISIYDTPGSLRKSNKLELYYAIYQDPEIGWLLNRNSRRDYVCNQFWGYLALTHGAPEILNAKIPETESVVLDDMGYAFLKSVQGGEYWDSGALTVHLRSGAQMVTHSHNDHFGIVVNAFHKNLYNDWYLYWDYLCPRPGRANMTPISDKVFNHNSITVDFREPDASILSKYWKTVKSDYIKFSDIRISNGMQIVSAEGSRYNGVNEKRTIGLVKEYVIDIYEVSSNHEHNYDFMLHSCGKMKFENLKEWKKYPRLNDEYYLCVIDTLSTKREGNIWFYNPKISKNRGRKFCAVSTDRDGTGIRTYFIDGKDSEIISTSTPFYVSVSGGWDDKPALDMPERNPMLVVRRKCKSTIYITVHQPVMNDSISLDCHLKGTKIIVNGEGFTDSYDIKESIYIRKSAHL